MEKEANGHSIADVPALLARRYNPDSSFYLRGVELVGYKKINNSTVMFYSDTFYNELSSEFIHKHYNCERLGRIKIFINDADTASYSMAEILKNLPEGLPKHDSYGNLHYNVAKVNMKLHVKDGNAKYPFTLHADSGEAEIRLVGIEERSQVNYAAKLRGVKRLDDF